MEDRKIKRLIRRLVGGGSTFKDFSKLVTGTAGAQLTNLGFTLLLARLYSPEAFGTLGLFMSVASFGATSAALRYDKALVLAKDDAEAKAVRRLCYRLVIGTSALVAVGTIIARRWMINTYGSISLANWMLVAGFAVFLSAQTNNLQYWLTRAGKFGILARNRLLQSLAIGLSQLIAFLVLPDANGLILGYLLGSGVTLIAVKRATPSVRGKLDAQGPSVKEVAKKYKNFPLFYAPKGYVDTIRNSMTGLLLGRRSVGGLGQYNMAYRMTMAPATLIQASMEQVFLKRLATVVPGSLLKLAIAALSRIGLVTFPMFVAFYLLAPWGFSTVLGAEWAEAGYFARALVPWIFANTLASPASNLYLVTNTQLYLLGFTIIYAIVPISILYFSTSNLLVTVQLLGLAMAVLQALSVTIALFLCRRYDAGARDYRQSA